MLLGKVVLMLRSHSRRRPLGAVFLILTLMITLFNATVPAHADDVGSFTIFVDPAIGNAGELTPKSFTFDYECSNTAGEPTVSGVLTVEVGSGVTITDVPIGQCDAYQRDASVPGADLGSTTVVSNQDVIWEDIAGAEFDVTGGRDTRITVWNVYSRHGTFEVSKVIEGIGDQSVGSYVFTYTCTDGQSGSLTVPGDGTSVEAGTTFPNGTECTVAEDPSSAQVPGYSVEVPQTQTVKIRNETSQRLSFTNAYTRDEGGFSVAKSVTGASAGDKEFTFTYDCTDGQTGSLTARGDGVAVVAGASFPLGTECTVSEDADAAQIDGYTLDVPQDRTVTVSERDQVVPVEFENVYTPVPEPTPSAPEESPSSPEPSAPDPTTPGESPEPSAPAPTQTPSAPVETPESSAPVTSSSPSESARRSSTSPSGLPRTGSGAAGLTAVAAAGALAALPLLRRRRR